MPRRRPVEYLPRLLSKWGHCSRREAEKLVVAGRVTVNGVVKRRVLDEVHPARDQIAVDGRRIGPAAYLYLKMHKPIGVVTTMKDPEGRPTVRELLPAEFAGAMPVGRLDQDSTGLLLLTNDHSLGDRISAPEHHVRKHYVVEVGGRPDDEAFAPIRAGVELDGERCRPAEVTILERRGSSTVLQFVLDEGKNRQIRRSLETIGLRVLALHRTRIGPIELGNLAAGTVAPLAAAELAELRAAVGRSSPRA